MRRIVRIFVVVTVFLVTIALGVRWTIVGWRNAIPEPRPFVVSQGEGIREIGVHLREQGFVMHEWPVFIYMMQSDRRHRVVDGTYVLPPRATIAEIIGILTAGTIEAKTVTIVFPEGWTSDQMADRLTAYGLGGEEFRVLVANPPQGLIAAYPVVARGVARTTTLEGYLFPDTYTFFKEEEARSIIARMLENFTERSAPYHSGAGERSFEELVIMASIIEGEVRSADDRATVSGIFWARLREGQKLQSDATLEFALRSGKIQHTAKDLENASPYNTYRFGGLPPGPVNNPGIASLAAAANPAPTPYRFFLSNPRTGETLYAVTHEEHVANKQKVGL